LNKKNIFSPRHTARALQMLMVKLSIAFKYTLIKQHKSKRSDSPLTSDSEVECDDTIVRSIN